MKQKKTREAKREMLVACRIANLDMNQGFQLGCHLRKECLADTARGGQSVFH